MLRIGKNARQSLAGDQARLDLVGVSLSGPQASEQPDISGITAFGETLTCDPGLWSGQGNVSISFQWLRNDAPINGATAQTFVLTSADEGALIDCRVTATDDYGTSSLLAGAVGPITSEPRVAATGGTVTDIVDPVDGLPYRVHTFLAPGVFTVTQAGDVEYLLIGSGASGAVAPGNRSAGPGASGVVRQGALALAVGSYPVSIFSGAPGVTATDTDAIGNPGSASTVLGITAPGGQAGLPAEATGGPSGVGGSNADFTGGQQRLDAGQNASGAAGSAADGADWDVDAGRGGHGVLSTISGAAERYASGGGAANRFDPQGEAGDGGGTAGSNTGASLAATRGSGSGGVAFNGGTSGDGGGGMFIVRYRREV